VPVLQYFLVVGSVLTGLLIYANNAMVPDALPFSVSQTTGLPEPYKAPAARAEIPDPVIVATSVELVAEVKKPVKPVKTARKHKPVQVARKLITEGRYAAYPQQELGSIW
jgi:hypothetical protein